MTIRCRCVVPCWHFDVGKITRQIVRRDLAQQKILALHESLRVGSDQLLVKVALNFGVRYLICQVAESNLFQHLHSATVYTPP